MEWNIISMWSSYTGPGQASCMWQLPGTIPLLLLATALLPNRTTESFHKNLMFNISFGCCRHSVSNTFVQLTEGRSARDQPKQPPAKKSTTTESFQMEVGPPYDKQRIQIGLRSGNTVLIYFRSGVGHYQSVLIALAADLHTNKPWQGQHKFWKYVSPIRTYFAWLPEQLARTYCRAALDRRPGLPYGEVHHLQGGESDFRHSMVFQNIYHIGDTKSAQELEVFLRMPRERLRLCCGIQCTDSLHPNGPRQRRKLFTAALKLLRFAIGIETVRCENEAQRALHAALLPLLRLEDGHVLATLSAVVLALCEGRTGLAISGVFGAGKTRSAAALLAGLLVFDPSLQLMVLTKENIAAHAVAEHLVSLQMPDYIQDKMGRLVGYYEQNRKGSYT